MPINDWINILSAAVPELLPLAVIEPVLEQDGPNDAKDDAKDDSQAFQRLTDAGAVQNPLWSAVVSFVDKERLQGRVRAVIHDHKEMKNIDPEDRQKVWDLALDRMEENGVDFPREQVATYDDFLTYLSDHGILTAERVRSLTTAFTVAATNERLDDPDAQKDIGRDRPIALVIGPRSDGNGAFGEYGFEMLDDLCDSGRFDVVYVECGTDQKVADAIRRVHAQTGRAVQTLILAGHGDRQSLALRDGGLDQNELDVEDLEKDGLFDGLQDALEPDADIILWSCSNGAPLLPPENENDTVFEKLVKVFDPPQVDPLSVPESDRYNLAEAVSHQFPGRRVIATAIPSNIRSLLFYDSGDNADLLPEGWLCLWSLINPPAEVDRHPKAALQWNKHNRPVIVQSSDQDYQEDRKKRVR